MNHYKLTAAQRAATGYTDLFTFKATTGTDSEFTAHTTNDLLLDIAMDTLNAGDVVHDKTVLDLRTALTPDPSANATVTISVGRTATAYTDILAASTVINAGTQLAAKTAFATGAAIGHQIIAADSTVLYCQVDITDTDGALGTITAGEWWIWMSIDRQTERPAIGDA
jgi:hypothetical protein